MLPEVIYVGGLIVTSGPLARQHPVSVLNARLLVMDRHSMLLKVVFVSELLVTPVDTAPDVQIYTMRFQVLLESTVRAEYTPTAGVRTNDSTGSTVTDVMRYKLMIS